jgi:hypothetical protein
VNRACPVIRLKPRRFAADSRTSHAELEPPLPPKYSVGQRSDVTASEENGAGTSEPYESKAYERRVRKRSLQVGRQILLERTKVVEENLTPLVNMWRI